MISARLGAALALALSSSWIVACSSSDDGGDAGLKDTGVVDSGVAPDSGAFPDAATPDAGPGTCDPVTGTGCTDQTQACVWVPPPLDQAQCRVVMGTAPGFEQACSNNNCAAGYACVQIEGETAATCHKVCDLNGAGSCNGLTGMSTNYTCSSIGGAFGVCTGTGATCVPYMDTCAANETCSLMGRNTTCAPAGTVQKGGDCSQMNCVKGAICINLQGTNGPTCYETCNPRTGMCPTAGDVCGGLQGLSFGICQTPQSACDPVNDMCPQGQACGLNGVNLQCEAAGTTPIGGDCTSENCARGGICLLFQGQPNAKCYQACNTAMPSCTAGTCQMTSLPFGVCN